MYRASFSSGSVQKSMPLFLVASATTVVTVLVRIRVPLRLAVYRQSLRLGVKPLETHGQNFFSQLSTYGHSPYITSSLTRGWVCHIPLTVSLESYVTTDGQSVSRSVGQSVLE
jgi:hypothetical protein